MQKKILDETTVDTKPASQKIVSQLDPRGFLVGPVMADVSPLGEPGEYLIPGGAIDRAPPQPMESGLVYWPDEEGSWSSIEDLRLVTLYLTTSGVPYTFGSNVDGHSYDGIGPCPDWLTQKPRPDIWSKWDGSGWVVDEALKASELTHQRAQEKTARLNYAGQIISPLQDAKSLGVATAQELDSLQSWMLYRVALSRIAPADHDIDWPDLPI